jgi:predicted small lipoprotein YifL
MKRQTLITALIAALLGMAAGCGQMGPLTLPDDTPETEEEQGDEENER